tara:strand:- start:1406 stop:4087 length:2682 start_codon:yes stop_codon:yes gene_type:complete
MKNILILGFGARENAIKEYLKPNVVHRIDTEDFSSIKQFCISYNIDLVIPSTEVYLCNGIVDYLQIELPKVEVFGPTKLQAKIEGSKIFSKSLMKELNIPTAEFSFYKKKDDFLTYLLSRSFSSLVLKPIVMKYSGLAKGKGVYLPESNDDAFKSFYNLYENNKNNWEGILIEERLEGPEVSVLAFCDGTQAHLMPQAQDYKRIYDDDKGPNTGGMGAICPVNILNENELLEVSQHINKVVKHLNYKGVLYAGIMKTKNGIQFLEFNCRFGDPEAQVILNLLDTNLLEIIEGCINNKYINIKWKSKHSAAVVLSHVDYPHSKLSEYIRINEESLDNTVKIYEGGTQMIDGYNHTKGGRVLTMVSTSNSLQTSLRNIYNNAPKITYDGVYYRRDIGSNYTPDSQKPINKNKNLSIAVLASGNATSINKLLEDPSTKQTIKVFVTNNNSPILSNKAYDNGIPCIYLGDNYYKKTSKSDYYKKIINILRLFDIDMVILSGFMMIVPESLFKEYYTINIHPSLLPKYKGMTGTQIHPLSLKNNDKFIGCTLHEVTETIDEGRFLIQKQRLLQKSNARSIKQQVQNLEKECIYDFVINYKNEKTDYDINIDEANGLVEDLKKNGIVKNDFCSIYSHKGIELGASADGCGTKLDLANEYGYLHQIGIDLVAMNVNDLIAGGCRPLFFMDYIAIDTMDKEKCNTIIKGIVDGCNMCDCKLIGGETAEMKGIYLKDKLDLAGFAVGEKVLNLPKKHLINKHCYVYGLKSSGIHSNGYTLVKKLWENSIDIPTIDSLLTPTRIYYELLELYSRYKKQILGVAHITGGGFYDNINRILPENLSIELFDWEFPDIFKWIMKESKLSRKDMLGIFNCGYGMVLITNEEIDIGDRIGRIVEITQYS